MTDYPFIQARYYTSGGMKEPRAIVLHMAEGLGTVSWLTHPTNDNSSHFVIERTGRIVQMVKLADADHSLHIDRPYGPPGLGDCGIFSLDVARDLLGAGIADPNAYLVAVEMEGWATAHYDPGPGMVVPGGPNAAQTTSLRALIADLQARRPTLRGLLGHRDFQDYKACPGCGVFDKVPHGAFTAGAPLIPAGDDMPGLTVALGDTIGTLAIPYHTDSIVVATGDHYAVPAVVSRKAVTAALVGAATETGYLVNLNPPTGPDVAELAFIRGSEPGLSFTAVPTTVDCTQAVAVAKAAGFEDALEQLDVWRVNAKPLP